MLGGEEFREAEQSRLPEWGRWQVVGKIVPGTHGEQGRADRIELVRWAMLGVHSCPRSSGEQS